MALIAGWHRYCVLSTIGTSPALSSLHVSAERASSGVVGDVVAVMEGMGDDKGAVVEDGMDGKDGVVY